MRPLRGWFAAVMPMRVQRANHGTNQHRIRLPALCIDHTNFILGRRIMFVATKAKPLATTIAGSLPRPHWFTANLRGQPFLVAFNGDAVYREQYSDAVAALISDQTRAGLDLVTDGEMRFDVDIGGRSWFGYAFDRMEGLVASESGAARSVGSHRRGFAQRAGTPG